MGFRRSPGWWARRFLRNFLAWIAIAFALFPALYVLGTSFNPVNNLATTRIIPRTPSVANYLRIFERGLGTWLLNTVKVAGVASAVSVAFCALGAYAFSRFRFRGRRAGLLALMLVQTFPQTLALVAIFLILFNIGRYVPWIGLNTHWGLVLVYLGGSIGFNTWLMKGFFDSIPRSLEESALVDGATHFQAFRWVILPLARPILAVIFVIQFIYLYSEYLIANVILKGREMYTLSVGLYNLIAQHYSDRWGEFAAGAVIGAAMILIIFYALQSQIISGLTRGAVKE